MKEKMPAKAARKLNRYAEKLDQHSKEHAKFVQLALNKYGELDEKGEPVIEYQGEGEEKRAVGYKLKDSEGFQKEMGEHMEDEFTIEVHPLYAAELENVQISPNDLTVMEPFIADLNNL
jgi:hypothetical protein